MYPKVVIRPGRRNLLRLVINSCFSAEIEPPIMKIGETPVPFRIQGVVLSSIISYYSDLHLVNLPLLPSALGNEFQ